MGLIKKVTFAQRLGGGGGSHVDIWRKRKSVSCREDSRDKAPRWDTPGVFREQLGGRCAWSEGGTRKTAGK